MGGVDVCVSLSGFLFRRFLRETRNGKNVRVYTVEKHEKTFLTQKTKNRNILEVEEFLERERAERTEKNR